MKTYDVIITPTAQKNLNDINKYISIDLSSPLTALNLEIELLETILSLEINPHRAPFFSNKFQITPMENVRKLLFKNYLVIFYIDESLLQVNIVSVYNRLMNKESFQ